MTIRKIYNNKKNIIKYFMCIKNRKIGGLYA